MVSLQERECCEHGRWLKHQRGNQFRRVTLFLPRWGISGGFQGKLLNGQSIEFFGGTTAEKHCARLSAYQTLPYLWYCMTGEPVSYPKWPDGIGFALHH